MFFRGKEYTGQERLLLRVDGALAKVLVDYDRQRLHAWVQRDPTRDEWTEVHPAVVFEGQVVAKWFDDIPQAAAQPGGPDGEPQPPVADREADEHPAD